MTTVAATEFARNFTAWREAAQREPVEVISHKRVAGYFISAREFEEFRRYKDMQPVARYVHEMSEEEIKAIAEARMDSRHDHLNALLD